MTAPTYNFYPWNFKNVVRADAEHCVIRGDSPMFGHSGHCGYCVFLASEVPVEWHGDYRADGLGLLNVHGGITYGEVHGDNDEERGAAVKAAVEKFYAENPIGDGVDHELAMKRISGRMDLQKKVAREIPYTHVVFGFDTAHAGDERNHKLFDADHVFELAVEMRKQIAEHARRIEEYRAADRERQLAILDEIRAAASIKSELSVMSMIGLAVRS